MSENRESRQGLSRRDFHKLSMAALGGALSGALLQGCTSDTGTDGNGEAGGEGEATADAHVCRGLNDCKGQGAAGENACRGQGKCATAEHHSCAEQNACKGQGGCGENPGENACKGQGACAVPLNDDAWKKARANMEEEWKAENKEFGEPPPKEA